jgi:general secretion pathway protein L
LARNGVQVYRGVRITEALQAARCVSTGESVDIAAQSIRKRENVIISLDDAHCFCRQVTLPAGAGTRIQAILDLDVSRVTPFARPDVINAWYLTGNAGSGATSVEHIIIRRRLVDDAISGLRRAGAKPIAIAVRRLGAAALPFVASPEGESFGRKRFRTWVKTAAVSVALLVLGLALLAGAYLHRQSQALAAIEERMSVAEKAALKVRGHVEKIETASREVRSLQQFRQQQHSMLEVWEELSRILPDGAWLQSLSLTQENLTAEGLAESAEDLISLLESSPLFERVRFASPVYKNPDEKRARFSISLQLAKTAPGNPP